MVYCVSSTSFQCFQNATKIQSSSLNSCHLNSVWPILIYFRSSFQIDTCSQPSLYSHRGRGHCTKGKLRPLLTYSIITCWGVQRSGSNALLGKNTCISYLFSWTTGWDAQLSWNWGILRPRTTKMYALGLKAGKLKYNNVDGSCGHNIDRKKSDIVTNTLHTFMNFI